MASKWKPSLGVGVIAVRCCGILSLKVLEFDGIFAEVSFQNGNLYASSIVLPNQAEAKLWCEKKASELVKQVQEDLGND